MKFLLSFFYSSSSFLLYLAVFLSARLCRASVWKQRAALVWVAREKVSVREKKSQTHNEPEDEKCAVKRDASLEGGEGIHQSIQRQRISTEFQNWQLSCIFILLSRFFMMMLIIVWASRQSTLSLPFSLYFILAFGWMLGPSVWWLTKIIIFMIIM